MPNADFSLWNDFLHGVQRFALVKHYFRICTGKLHAFGIAGSGFFGGCLGGFASGGCPARSAVSAEKYRISMRCGLL